MSQSLINNKLAGKSRAESVTEFFDHPLHYLSAGANIRVRAEILRELLGRPQHSAILDIGCGDGSLSAQFCNSGNRLTLIDLSRSMISLARNRFGNTNEAQVSFIHGDFLTHPLSEPYDIILCVGVLAHVESIESALCRISKLLKPGGCCILQWTDNDRILTRINRQVALLRECLGARRKYLMNATRTSHIVPAAAAVGLYSERLIRYAVTLPGMSMIPAGVMFRYLKTTIDNPLTDRISSEVVASFFRA